MIGDEIELILLLDYQVSETQAAKLQLRSVKMGNM